MQVTSVKLLIMKRKSLTSTQCPIARSLDRVGDWWSMLILLDALHGFTRFDQFQKNLDISPNILTSRLNKLVEDGLLERSRYSEHPPRDEYLLTACGRDFEPVLIALMAWGNQHFAPEGVCLQLVDTQTQQPADPVFVDRNTGRTLGKPDFKFAAGPAASERLRHRLTEAGDRV
jgi:DNA-binding HxlR family transcriptional regulator